MIYGDKLYGVETKTAVDFLEPIEDDQDLVRDARVKSVRLLNIFASQIEAVLSRPSSTITEIASAFWGAAYALGLNCCEGVSMSERAASIGCERATISKSATHMIRAAGIAPSWHMKKAHALDKYRDARLNVVKKSQKGGGQ